MSIGGFPFLAQVIERDLGHVTLTDGTFCVDTTANRQGGCLYVDRLRLDLRDVQVTSLAARSVEADLATGTLMLSYKELSAVLTRLAAGGSVLRVSQAPGSRGREARIKVSGAVRGTALNSMGALLAQGVELTVTVPGAARAAVSWRVDLPAGVGFTAARATTTGIGIGLAGRQVALGSSRYDG